MVIISGLIDSFTCKLDAETFEGADINIGQHNGSMSLTFRLILKAAEVQVWHPLVAALAEVR